MVLFFAYGKPSARPTHAGSHYVFKIRFVRDIVRDTVKDIVRDSSPRSDRGGCYLVSLCVYLGFIPNFISIFISGNRI